MTMADFQPILSDRYRLENSHTLAVAEKVGAYATARRALISLKTEQIQAEVKAANIRGRGGAGFPAGMKWGFLAKREGVSPYLVINADEGEPGTFKDRTIMELDPHRLIEGCIITCYAIGAHVCYIYVRCELQKSIARLECRHPRGARPRLSRRSTLRRQPQHRDLHAPRRRRVHLR